MPINLRGLPIQGILADAAGNIIRNATVTIKEDAPNGTFVVDSATSDNNGYFITAPIKNGTYDIYESGAKIMRVYHSAQPTQLQPFSPSSVNVPASLATFASYAVAPGSGDDINKFKIYLQMEPESNNDVPRYGNAFPLWNVNPSNGLSGHPFEKMKNVHTGINGASLLTHTRFDVEYYTPMTRGVSMSSHRRLRWRGIPGLIFQTMGKIVLGLDYYGIIPKNSGLKINTTDGGGTAVVNASRNTVDASSKTMKLDISSTLDPNVSSFLASLGVGDIVMVKFANGKMFWGIYYYQEISGVPTNHVQLNIKWWASSNNSHSVQGVQSCLDIDLASSAVQSMTVYQGMYNGIEALNQSVGERFFVVENVEAQNQYPTFNADGTLATVEEVFNYGNA